MHKMQNDNEFIISMRNEKGQFIKGVSSWMKGRKGMKFSNRKSPPPFTKEHLANLSKGHTGHPVSQETIEKIVKANTGRKRTAEARKNMSLAHIGIKTIPCSEEKKRKIGIANTGEKNGMFGEKSWNSGKLLPQFSKENHWNWKGGKSFEPYPLDWTDTLKESIRERDNFVCQECGVHQDELERKLDVHHIDYINKL